MRRLAPWSLLLVTVLVIVVPFALAAVTTAPAAAMSDRSPAAPIPVEKKEHAVGQGLFFSGIVTDDGRTLFSLPPRYRGHEDTLGRAHLFGGGVKPAVLRNAWGALRQMLGGRAMEPAPTVA